MGIYCETDIQTPPGGVFVPGSPVTGVIRYNIDEGTSIDEIILSLKGFGSLNVIEHSGTYSNTYFSEEKYVYIATVVKMDQGGPASSARQYETEFNFTLPDNIPSSLYYKEQKESYTVNCKISYHIRAKFIISGLLSFNKKFANEIQVVSTAISPKLPMKPNVHGQSRKLFQLFGKEQSIVNIKATIQNSVVNPGGNVVINYEVQNNTNLVISAVKSKLLEVYDFYEKKKHIVELTHKVKDLESKTGAVKSRDTFKSSCEIVLPPNLLSIENSKLLKRGYIFLITVKLPVPCRNINLKIPLQIGYPVTMDASGKGLQINYPVKVEDVSSVNRSLEVAGTSYDPSPSYWQSMKETDSLSLAEDLEENIDSNDHYQEINDSSNTNESISKKPL